MIIEPASNGSPSSRNRGWNGRFPHNEIITLLDVNRKHNLAESTSATLGLGELLDLVDLDRLRALPLGYGSAQGAPSLREAIGELSGISPDMVLTTQGAALGLFLLAFEVCGRGSDAILPTPCFPPARDTLMACGVHVQQPMLSFADSYRIDVAQIEELLTPATRLVSLASPQNPSGVQVPSASIHALLDAMAKRAPKALLFLDETYREAVYGNNVVLPSAANLDPRVVTGGSVSKAHGAPGLRVGWLTVPDPALRERLTVAKMNLTISGSPLDETLAAALLTQRETILAPRRRMLAQALDEVRDWMAIEAHRLEWVEPERGALCCVRLRHTHFDDSAVNRFWLHLAEHELQLAPGDWFGETVRVFRLGFGYLPLEDLRPALRSLSRHMDVILEQGTAHGHRGLEPPR